MTVVGATLNSDNDNVQTSRANTINNTARTCVVWGILMYMLLVGRM